MVTVSLDGTARVGRGSRAPTPSPYVLEPGLFAPDLHSDRLIAYKDGHLCAACESVVEASLASRRTTIAAAEFTDRRGPA